MGENSKISWTHHTFNPWIGCTKIAAGCANCYAAAQDKLRRWTSNGWGAGQPRKRTSEANWKQPLKWDREAKAAGERRRVFCASLADVFDEEVPDDWRFDLFELILRCPNLDWLLLTKRPNSACAWFERVRSLILSEFPIPNVWLGVSIATQADADKNIPILLKCRASVRFVSAEPLIEAVDLSRVVIKRKESGPDVSFDALQGWHGGSEADRTRLDWVIVGGESGPGARPCDVAWVRSIVQQCQAAGVPVFVKQLGQRPVTDSAAWEEGLPAYRKVLKDRKGGNMEEWPEDLRVRQFPEAAHAK